MEELSKKTKILITVAAIILFSGFITVVSCLNSIDKHEYGFTFNRFTGEITPIGRTGWIWLNPFKYSVHTIDLRPYQLSITANMNIGTRILNAKLCRFNPKGLDTFVKWHGKDAGDDLKNLKEILKCYAFAKDGGKSCPFLIVDDEINPNPSPNMDTKSQTKGKIFGQNSKKYFILFGG